MDYYAIVIGDWHFNSLGIIRSLGENGVTVYFINLSDGGYGEDSRYTKKVYHTKDDIVSVIFEILNENSGKAVLFPSSDKAALEIDKNRNTLSNRCIVPGCAGCTEKYMDKSEMCKVASDCGFVVPKSEIIISDKDVSDKIKQFGFPCIIKPVISTEGSKSDIFICRCAEDIDAFFVSINNSECEYDRLLIQEFINGKSRKMVEFCGYKVKGEKVRLLGQIDKIREYPMFRGSTSYAVLKEKQSCIDESILDVFLESVGYDGIFDLEILVSDDVPYFIEINYRNGAPSYAYTKAGFNIIYQWYCNKTGMKSPQAKISETFLMCERDDLNNVKDKNISVFKWIKNIMNTNAFMLYNSKDPKPFEAAYGKAVERIFALLAKAEN